MLNGSSKSRKFVKMIEDMVDKKCTKHSVRIAKKTFNSEEELDKILNHCLNDAFKVKKLRNHPNSNNIAEFVIEWLEGKELPMQDASDCYSELQMKDCFKAGVYYERSIVNHNEAKKQKGARIVIGNDTPNFSEFMHKLNNR